MLRVFWVSFFFYIHLLFTILFSLFPDHFSVQTLIHEGGLVPKHLYKSESIEETNGAIQAHDHHGLYKAVDLKPGQLFELLIRNTDPKSVLTWDFEVLKNDTLFAVFHTEKEIEQSGNGMALAKE